MRPSVLVATSLGFALVVLGTPGRVTAGETLDQAQEQSGDNVAFYQPQGCPSAGVKGAAQTFTAGLSGTLTRVDLYLAKTSWTTDAKGISVEIRAGEPAGALLASSDTVLAADIPFEPDFAWVSFTFAAVATVTAGQGYAIVLPPDLAAINDVDPTYRWPGPFSDVYAGGATWDYYCPSDQWEPYVFGSDRTFRTYVERSGTAVRRPSWGALKSLYR